MSSLQETIQNRSEAPNLCSRCGSDNVTELGTEINIHILGQITLEVPGIFVFPRLTACMICGCARLVLQDDELRLIKRRLVDHALITNH